MKTIGHGIVINASPSAVWRVLMDWPRFGAWNPFLTDVEGEPRLGSRLSVRIAPPGGRPMRFRPKLTALEAESRLQWLGRAGLPGMFDGRHTFSLTALPGRPDVVRAGRDVHGSAHLVHRISPQAHTARLQADEPGPGGTLPRQRVARVTGTPGLVHAPDQQRDAS